MAVPNISADPVVLRRIHEPSFCLALGLQCPVHAPSYHKLHTFKVEWRTPALVQPGWLRTCGCNRRHPDPDDVEWMVILQGIPREEAGRHSCCGCCKYNYSEPVWHLLGRTENYLTAKENAEALYLHPTEWAYDQFQGIMYRMDRGWFKGMGSGITF
jgi:hypothetical protein